MEIVSTLKGRRCATAFEMGTAVPTTVVDAAIVAATSAVDHTGREPWRFKVLGRRRRRRPARPCPRPELGTDGPVAPGCWW